VLAGADWAEWHRRGDDEPKRISAARRQGRLSGWLSSEETEESEDEDGAVMGQSGWQSGWQSSSEEDEEDEEEEAGSWLVVGRRKRSPCCGMLVAPALVRSLARSGGCAAVGHSQCVFAQPFD
jgi:hypothetical protein